MNHALLKSVIYDQHEFIRDFQIVPRNYEFEENGNYVLVGLRRAGKSTLLYKIVLDLVASGVDWEQIVYINFEDERLSEFTAADFNDLLSVQSEMSDKKGYFFLDEVQNIDGWEKFARRMADAKEHIYITGSNAKMLSREIETTLGGRFFARHITPYAFGEYLTACGIPHNEPALLGTKTNGKIRAACAQYLQYGGLPESLLYKAKREYISGVYQKVLLGDIITRNSIRNDYAVKILIKKMGGLINKPPKKKNATAIAEIMSGIFDIPGYNYASSRYKIDARNHPEQATTGSETLPQTLYDNWQLVKSIPTMTGDFMWTGYDYLGESGIGTIQYKDKKTKQNADPGLIISGGAGIIDICGKKRPEVGWSKIIWGLQKTPTIGVDPYTRTDYFQSLSMWRVTDAVESWSWEGCEGKKASVTIYSDADKIELLVNGKSAGKKKPKKDIAKFRKIPYEAGKIEAIAYDSSGKETARTTLVSATGKTSIKLTPETTNLCANGQDLCFLNIDLIGENGITKSSVDQELKIEISGPATLQGYGSARPNVEESFCNDTFKTFYGKSLAVIRAGYEPGTVTVKVSGKGLDTQELTLNIC